GTKGAVLPALAAYREGPSCVPGRCRRRCRIYRTALSEPSGRSTDAVRRPVHPAQIRPARLVVCDHAASEARPPPCGPAHDRSTPPASRGRHGDDQPLARPRQRRDNESLRRGRPRHEARSDREGPSGGEGRSRCRGVEEEGHDPGVARGSLTESSYVESLIATSPVTPARPIDDST